MLFLGGDSQRSYAKGRGGVATGCNAVIVPLDQVLGSSIQDRDKLIAVLLDHGALANGPHGCKTPPLSVAMDMEDYAIAYTLLRHGADPAVIGCYRGTASHHREVIYAAYNNAYEKIHCRDVPRQLLAVRTKSVRKLVSHQRHDISTVVTSF